ncbi:MAG TPA: pantetheine-phosphate adenylyltransferase [Chloroflexota bacterium]|nr:pantetheine-phosphate adenylyltransferase [Chloroflexota bacterium]
MRAIFPASFDPITNGHLDIATRASHLFDQLVIAVYDKPDKQVLLPWPERIALARAATAHLANTRVEGFRGLMVEYARGIGADVVVRGLRVVSDFEGELVYASANRALAPTLETICLICSPDLMFISSSRIKEIALLGGDISAMVPPPVVERLARLVRERRAEPGG